MNRLSIVGDWYAHADSLGKYVRYTDVQSLQAERDRLNAVVSIGKEAESLFVELTSDGRLDIRTDAAMELCEVFQRFQDARKALEGGGCETV
jgi:hypothetical protein